MICVCKKTWPGVSHLFFDEITAFMVKDTRRGNGNRLKHHPQSKTDHDPTRAADRFAILTRPESEKDDKRGAWF